MSTPAVEPAAETATGVSANAATENAANEADKHTPSTDDVAPPSGSPADPSNSDTGTAELRELVTDLATQVATLTNLVAKGTAPDEGAGERLPWALRGKKEL